MWKRKEEEIRAEGRVKRGQRKQRGRRKEDEVLKGFTDEMKLKTRKLDRME